MDSVTVVEAARRLGISEKTIRRAVHAGKLPASYPKPNRCEIAINDLEAWKKGPPTAQERVEQRLAEMEQRLAALETQVRDLRQSQAQQPATPARTSEKIPDRQPPKTALPDDLVALYAFADLHAISRNEADRRWKAGFIDVVKGPWGSGKQRITVALDAKGRRDFWVQFHNTPGFKACDHCPHVSV